MRGSFAYACVMGVIGVFCTGAWAQTPVMSVRLGGYIPNTYGQCRPPSGLGDGTGASCTVSTDCTVGGEICGQLFRDISCSALGAVGDADCLAATRGPSKCELIKIFPVEGPTGTALRCSAVGLAPQGMVGQGDTLFLEVFADEWDQTPDVGLCTNGINACTIGEFEPCKSCRDVNGGAGPPCADSSDCTDSLLCRLDNHCAVTGGPCQVGSQCAASEDCVPDTCDDFPSIKTYQWTIDSSGFSNGHGPANTLRFGDLPCTTGTVLDDCNHGYPIGCTTCSAATCNGGTCSAQADVFMFTPRLDFIFNGLSPVIDCSSATDNATCGAGLSGGNPPIVDDGTHKYLGTTMVTVSDGACGTFRVGLSDDPIKTFFNDGFGVLLPGLVTNPVTLEINARGDCGTCDDDGNPCTRDFCNCGDPSFCVHPPIACAVDGEVCDPSTGECGPPVGCELLGMTSTPLHCSIDPGIPHSIDVTEPALGWNTIDLTFGTVNDCDTSELTTGDFSVAVTPNDVAVGVGGVVSTGTNTATVTLTVPIPARHWVCLTHDGPAATGGSEMTCLGALPADANATHQSSAADIGAVIECLVSGTCEVWMCDIDRLGACTGADVEETVNLLNGAGLFDTWDGKTFLETIPECPATP